MIVPNKYCPMGMQNALACKGELCMWFDGERCNPLGLPKAKPEAAEKVEASAEATVEDKPKTTRRKKDATLTQ